MTHEEKRFYAAVVAMDKLLLPENFSRVLEWRPAASIPPSQALAMTSVKMVDALLAELDNKATIRNNLTVQPDADGWIPHKPGDPMPCDRKTEIFTKLQCGAVVRGSWEAGYCDWSADNGPENIVAWKPA